MTNFSIPPSLLFGGCLSACARRTWLQLACLAGDDGRTPQLGLDELLLLTGKSRATLYRHLGRLRQAGLGSKMRIGRAKTRTAGGELSLFGELEVGWAARQDWIPND